MKSNNEKSFTIILPRCVRKWRNDATSLCHILCFLAPFRLDSRQYIYKVLFLPWTSILCFLAPFSLDSRQYIYKVLFLPWTSILCFLAPFSLDSRQYIYIKCFSCHEQVYYVFRLHLVWTVASTVCGPWSAQVPDALGPRLFRKW